MAKIFSRRQFVNTLAFTGAGVTLTGARVLASNTKPGKTVSVGMIGLDTSHSPAFTRLINNPTENTGSPGYRVVAAYPYGSRTIESSYSRIPRYIEEVEPMGVEIVNSVEELLAMVDCVMLLTNDGNSRREQALQVMQAGKPMYMDKPVAASLQDVLAIYEASKQYDVPVFSTSARRYVAEAQAIRNRDEIGHVLGADTYCPLRIEPSHPDLFWYGIHGVEMLFTVMGGRCQSVTRTKSETSDVVVGTWQDGRIGTFRGLRDGRFRFGGQAFGSEKIVNLNTYDGYGALVNEILTFFRSGNPPVDEKETLEIYAFMEAADESLRRNGEAVRLHEVLDHHQN